MPERAVRYFTGSGSPEGAVVAPPGSIYHRTSDNTLWDKTSGTGNTGWVPRGTGGGGAEGYLDANGDMWVDVDSGFNYAQVPTISSVGSGAGAGATASIQSGSDARAGLIILNTGTPTFDNSAILTLALSSPSVRAKPICMLAGGNLPVAFDAYALYQDHANTTTTSIPIRIASGEWLTGSSTLHIIYTIIGD